MAAITSSTLGELLKRLYSSEDITQLCNLVSQVLDKCAARGNAMLGGSGFYGPVRSQSAEGHGYITESADLPDPQQTTVKTWLQTPAVQVGVIQLSGLSQAVSSTNAMAFANAFDENVQSTIQSMTVYKEGAFFRDGTGKLATVTTDPGASASGWVFDDVGFLREGMPVIFNDVSAGTDYFGPYTIILVDWPTKTVTFDSAVSATVTTSDTLYMNDTQGPNGTAVASNEPKGVEAALLTTGTYLGIDRALVGNWRSSGETVSGLLDATVLTRHRTRIIQETGLTIGAMGDRFNLVCHQMQADRLFQVALPKVRYAGTDMIDLGNSGNVKFGNIGIVTSYQCSPSKAYLGDWSFFRTMYTPNGELHIDTEHNGAALKWVSNKDVGQVYMKSYHNFVCTKPIAFSRLTSLTELTR